MIIDSIFIIQVSSAYVGHFQAFMKELFQPNLGKADMIFEVINYQSRLIFLVALEGVRNAGRELSLAAPL